MTSTGQAAMLVSTGAGVADAVAKVKLVDVAAVPALLAEIAA